MRVHIAIPRQIQYIQQNFPLTTSMQDIV